MGPIVLNPKITKAMDSWGGNYNNTDGNGHDSSDDKVSKQITSKDVTLNTPSGMDAPHPKLASDNSGVDKSFWSKANPQTDTQGHGKLSRSTKDTHDRM